MMNKWICLGILAAISGCSAPPREQPQLIEPTYSYQRDAPTVQPVDTSAAASPRRDLFTAAQTTLE